jgi:DNA-directed RNA polymerase
MHDQQSPDRNAQRWPGLKEQIELEEWMRCVGAGRAVSKGWERGAASFMAHRMIDRVVQTALEYYRNRSTRAQSNGAIWDLFHDEDTVIEVTIEMMLHVFGNLHGPSRYIATCAQLGKLAEYVLWLRHPTWGGRIHLKGLRLASNNDLGMNLVMQRLKDSGLHKTIHYRPLKTIERTALGGFFIEAMIAATKMLEVVIRYDARARKYRSIECTTLYWDFLRRWKRNLLLFRPMHMPMLIPPKPYTELADGGYYTIVTPCSKLPWENYKIAHRETDECVLGSLNIQQSIPFQLDWDQINLMEEIWTLNREVGGLPARDKLVMPNDLEEYKKGVSNTERWKKVWRVKADERKDGIRAKFINALISAEKIREYQQIYFCWQQDHRGRMYPRGSQLNITGSDPFRSMIRFDVTAPMAGNTEEFAWALGDAAGIIPDWQARVSYLEENRVMIQRVGLDPLTAPATWEDKKKPWKFVQLCREWARYAQDVNYRTGVVFQIDQSASGYGHVACLTRDARLAEWVNITGDSYSDLYTAIGKIVREEVNKAFIKLANADDLRMLRWWLEEWPDRTMFKNAIMPVIYGRSHLTLMDAVIGYLRDRERDFRNVDGDNIVKLGGLLAGYINAGIKKAIPNVLSLSRWMALVGKAQIKAGMKPHWYTPNGLLVESYASETKHRTIDLLLSGRRARFLVRDNEGMPVKNHTRQLAADYIHSMDAAFLQRFVYRWGRMGNPLVTIHDCFGTTLDRVRAMRVQLNKEFNNFYGPDRLDELWKMAQAECGELPPPPMIGTLDTTKIGENPFLFT